MTEEPDVDAPQELIDDILKRRKNNKPQSPFHFGKMEFKPEIIEVLPVKRNGGKPWRGEVKPRHLREQEPYRHPFLNTDSRD